MLVEEFVRCVFYHLLYRSAHAWYLRLSGQRDVDHGTPAAARWMTAEDVALYAAYSFASCQLQLLLFWSASAWSGAYLVALPLVRGFLKEQSVARWDWAPACGELRRAALSGEALHEMLNAPGAEAAIEAWLLALALWYADVLGCACALQTTALSLAVYALLCVAEAARAETAGCGPWLRAQVREWRRSLRTHALCFALARLLSTLLCGNDARLLPLALAVEVALWTHLLAGARGRARLVELQERLQAGVLRAAQLAEGASRMRRQAAALYALLWVALVCRFQPVHAAYVALVHLVALSLLADDAGAGERKDRGSRAATELPRRGRWEYASFIRHRFTQQLKTACSAEAFKTRA